MHSFRPVLLVWVGLLPLSSPAAVYEVDQRAVSATDAGPGSVSQPWKTLGTAADHVGPGDTVRIHDGIYRERVVVKASGTEQAPIRFEAFPGAHVVLTGADRVTHWERLDTGRPVYTTAWDYRFINWSPHLTHPDDDYHRLIGRCEQVMIENYLLRQVLEQAQMAPGTFFVDVSNRVLLVWDRGNRDVNKLFVEASARQEILRAEGGYVQVRGLHFRYAANMAQHGAVVLAGSHDLLEDCTLEDMNSSGATFSGQDQIVRRCTFRNNGQLGFGANGAHRLLFTECLVENNNIKGFDRGWEAGGDKLVLCRDAVLDRSRFLANRGNGIWFDIGNEHCIVQQCLIAENEDAGIFYEISYGLQAHDNVILGNGFAPTPGAWGAQAGISLSSSPDCVVERNIILGNREGFNFREQNRTTPRIGQQGEVAVWNHDQKIRHNIIAWNRDAQVWGWFDVGDQRHWPAAGMSPQPGPASATGKTPAENLSLEQLRVQFEGNLYFAGVGQGWFNWGTSWGRHTNYSTLPEFQSGLGIDSGGKVMEPAFNDPAARDFRLSPAAMKSCGQDYPRAPVPSVLLGILR